MTDILIVDDSAEIVEVLGMMVEAEGYRAKGVTSGREALRALSEDCPDLVLLDLMMPDVDGFDVLRKMRSTPDLESVPVIVITASAKIDVERQVLAAGAKACLFKPFNPDELLDRIARELHESFEPVRVLA